MTDNTLNGALENLGKLMATNLSAKGVLSANASDGLTTLANKILQVGYTLELASKNNILSFYDYEYCVLTATVTDNAGVGVSDVQVVFRKEGTILDSVMTNSDGVAEYTYQSTGVGDVTITVECMDLQETCSIEDCIVARPDEVNVTKASSNYYAYDDNLEFELPSEFEMYVDLKTTGASTDNEHRLYIAPSSAYTSSMSSQSQPNPSLFVGYGGSATEFGVRVTSTDMSSLVIDNMNGVYHSFAVKQVSTSAKGYVDGKLITSKTFNSLSDYTSFKILLILWAEGTVSIKNLKIKAPTP